MRDSGCHFPLRFRDTASVSSQHLVFSIGIDFTSNQFLVVEMLVWMISYMGLDMELAVVPNHVFGPFPSTVRERAVHTGSSHLASVVMAIPYVPLVGDPPIAVFALSAPSFHEPTIDMAFFLPFLTDMLSIFLWAQGLEELDDDEFFSVCESLHETVCWMKGRGVDENAKLILAENELIDWYINNSASLDEYTYEGFILVFDAFGSN